LKKSFLVRQGYFDDQNNPFDVDFQVFGKGFKYDSLFPGAPQVPVDGVIKAIDVWVDGQLGVEMDGLYLPVPKASKLLGDDPFKVFATLLSGDDTIIGSEYSDPNLFGFKGNDMMWGRGGGDIVDGFKGDDVNDGGGGNDQLIDTKGYDVFQFSTEFMIGPANLGFNFDAIEEFGPKDRIYLTHNYFGAAGMTVEKDELAFSDHALDGNDFFLFVEKVFYYDQDANGAAFAPTPIFATTNDAKLTHKLIEIGYEGY
jgi:Ca2+-binding RTX toxin-like protein